VSYIGNEPTVGQWRKLTDISSSFDGVTTTFTTSVPPGTSAYYVTAGSASQLIISLGGVIQEPDVDYTVSTNSITFTTAPASGLSFFGVLCGDALNVGTPGDGSVTTSKLGSNLSVDLTSGSAATPSLTFDANTGLYSPGEDQVAISTGGTGRLFVDSSGRLGLGTSSISAKLHIRDGTTEDVSGSIIRLDLAGTNPYWEVQAVNGVNSASRQLRFSHSALGGATPLTITQENRVGIGTTAPSSQFSVGAGAGGTPTISLDYTVSNTSIASISASHNTGEVRYSAITNYFPTFYSSGSERARIDTSGRLLVGTSSTSSEAKLLVQGNASNNVGWLDLALNATTTASGTTLGGVRFKDSSNSEYASIGAWIDSTGGTNDYPGRLVFSTTADGASSPTERMRIGSGGTTGVFGTNTDVFSSRSSAGAGTTYSLFTGYHSSSAPISGGTLSFNVTTNGNVTNTNNSYGSISDIKLKENIVDANSQWDDLKALQVRKYNFKEGQTHTQIGLIAQEVELVSPGLVSESPDRDEEGNDLGTVTKSVNYSVLYMKAVKALQEAMKRIETLEAKVAALEAQ
jgi:hypothetical protein